MTERKIMQTDLNYILELTLVQGDLLHDRCMQDDDYDLHTFGQFVGDVYYSKTLDNAWKLDTEYKYMTDMFEDTELIERAIEEVLANRI